MIRYICLTLLLGLILSSCRTAKIKTENNATNKHLTFMGIPLSGEEDKAFLEYISPWIGAPYKYGGKSKNGTDCSGLVFTTYKEVFGIDIPRSTPELYKQAKTLKNTELKCGDLVFFDIKRGSVSHVGMHITGQFFVHSSTKKGVIISSLDESYYKEHFIAFGTFRKN